MERKVKLFALLLLGLFVFSILGSFASAANVTTSDKIVEFAKGGFTKVFGVDFSSKVSDGGLIFTKFLVFLLIVIIVFGVTDMLPFFPSGGMGTTLKIFFSLIVAYLGIIYVAPAEMYASLLGYGAFVVAATVAIPFLLVLGFYAKMASDPRPERILIAKFLVLFFALYYLFRLFVAFLFPPAGTQGVPLYVMAIFVAATIAMGLIFIFDARIRHFFLKTKMKGYMEEADLGNKREMLARVAQLRTEATALATTNPTEAARIDAMAKNLETYANSL